MPAPPVLRCRFSSAQGSERVCWVGRHAPPRPRRSCVCCCQLSRPDRPDGPGLRDRRLLGPTAVGHEPARRAAAGQRHHRKLWRRRSKRRRARGRQRAHRSRLGSGRRPGRPTPGAGGAVVGWRSRVRGHPRAHPRRRPVGLGGRRERCCRRDAAAGRADVAGAVATDHGRAAAAGALGEHRLLLRGRGRRGGIRGGTGAGGHRRLAGLPDSGDRQCRRRARALRHLVRPAPDRSPPHDGPTGGEAAGARWSLPSRRCA